MRRADLSPVGLHRKLPNFNTDWLPFVSDQSSVILHAFDN